MAIRDIGVDFEHYRLVEYDKYPVASYNAIHGTNFPTTDIREFHGDDLGIVDTDLWTYIITYSFPCQDLSVAGKMKGMSKGSGTRSGLLWEVERLLNETDNLPQVLLMENVPQVIADANIADFRDWQDFLENKGYTNYVNTLNAKNYGVAQNRERTFMVSLLGDWNYKFPQTVPLTKTMADYLEDEVDEKYYINSEKAQTLIQQLIDGGQLKDGLNCADGSINNPKVRDVSNCIKARYDAGISNQRSDGGGGSRVQELGFIEKGTGQHQSNTIYSADGISPCLNAVNYKEPLKVIV
jgi:DNA (cytosine-5)-methyltransferase 1